MNYPLLQQIRRGLRKPPHVLVSRGLLEIRRAKERLSQSLRPSGVTCAQLLRVLQEPSVTALWERLARQPALAYAPDSPGEPCCGQSHRQLCGEDAGRIFAAADRACRHQVDLLGSGPVERVAMCDAVVWSFLGLSMAGWNALISFALAVFSLLAAKRPKDARAPRI